ncbi:MAG: [FeFe] hydrogenase H-cluster radical SAM maturase HydE [Coriobacteriia bacterium]|nr:[FeFe] hydrogenase H-cluster radical SAM maturase HydE [Coriobacteriia bacterium]
MDELTSLVDRLAAEHSLSIEEYERLVRDHDEDVAAYAADLAVKVRKDVYGNKVFVRGLIEFSSFCKRDCDYCGLRRSIRRDDRYRLTTEQILECTDEGYANGLRTFVLQSGEDPYWTDERLCDLIRAIKERHPDCAVTISVGERSRESYQRLLDAGADRYLLRHEAANPAYYRKIHPADMSHDERMSCIRDLKDVGFTVGVGFMVGSPHQTPYDLACDLKFIEEFKPHMCGIGPFVSHHATPYANEPNGSVDLTCFLLSLMRLIQPNLLIPATTSLGTLDPKGREKGMLSGANVVMPNLSPKSVRESYDLYDNKVSNGQEAAEGTALLRASMEAIGYEVVVDRGDPA